MLDHKSAFRESRIINDNGLGFLSQSPRMTFIGKSRLLSSYISNSRNSPSHDFKSFDIAGFRVTEYIVDENSMAVIAPIRATELVVLDGISDQSLFAYMCAGRLVRRK